MTGNDLISYVRKILHDEWSDYIQGEFWSDDEILLALNAAQNIFLNNVLKLKEHHYLRWLIKRTDYQEDTNALPGDYVHYMNAKVGEENDLKLAEIYLGGLAKHHWRTVQAKVLIIHDVFYYRRHGVATGGRMYYYRRPSKITMDTINLSWDEDVYKVQIVNLATVICAMKETSTSREFKRMKRWLNNLITDPKTDDNYIYDWEVNDDNRDIQSPKNAS